MAPGSVRRNFHWVWPNAGAAAHAGLDLLRMYNMQNTNDYLNAANSIRFTKNRKKQKTSKHEQTSKQQATPTHNQQASKVSSTVDHGPGTPDPQA